MNTKKDTLVKFRACFACRMGTCSRGTKCRHKARDQREEKFKVGLHNHQGCTCYRTYAGSMVVEKKAPVAPGRIDLTNAAGPAQREFLSGDWSTGSAPAQSETPEYVNKPTMDHLDKVARLVPAFSTTTSGMAPHPRGSWLSRGKALVAAEADININVKRASDRFKVITNGLRQQLKNKEEECKRLAATVEMLNTRIASLEERNATQVERIRELRGGALAQKYLELKQAHETLKAQHDVPVEGKTVVPETFGEALQTLNKEFMKVMRLLVL